MKTKESDISLFSDASKENEKTFSEELFETAVKIIRLQGEQILNASQCGKFPHS